MERAETSNTLDSLQSCTRLVMKDWNFIWILGVVNAPVWGTLETLLMTGGLILCWDDLCFRPLDCALVVFSLVAVR